GGPPGAAQRARPRHARRAGGDGQGRRRDRDLLSGRLNRGKAEGRRSRKTCPWPPRFFAPSAIYTRTVCASVIVEEEAGSAAGTPLIVTYQYGTHPSPNSIMVMSFL